MQIIGPRINGPTPREIKKSEYGELPLSPCQVALTQVLFLFSTYKSKTSFASQSIVFVGPNDLSGEP